MPSIKLTLERRSPADLARFPANAKQHPASQVEAIKGSIQRFGFNDPIGILPDGTIVEGEGRLSAALALGLETVPVLVIEGLSARDADLYRIAHNKITLSTGFDIERLTESLRELAGSDISVAVLGFADNDARNILSAFGASGDTDPAHRAAIYQIDIVWDTDEQKSRFGAFLSKVEAESDGLPMIEALIQRIEASGVLDEVEGETEENAHVTT